MDVSKPFACRLAQARSVDLEAQAWPVIVLPGWTPWIQWGALCAETGGPPEPAPPGLAAAQNPAARGRLMRRGAPGAERAARMAVSLPLLASQIEERLETSKSWMLTWFCHHHHRYYYLLASTHLVNVLWRTQRQLLRAGSAPLEWPGSVRETCKVA